jgi:glycolate oxidase iron-sulfur subunit
LAGQFSLFYQDLSQKIAERKVESVESTDADIVVTACPGCQFQLEDNITRLKNPQKVMNLMEILS